MTINNQLVVEIEKLDSISIVTKHPREIVFSAPLKPYFAERFVTLEGVLYEIISTGSNPTESKVYFKATRLFEMITRNGPTILEGHQWFAAVPPPELAIPFTKDEKTFWAVYQRGQNIETHEPMLEGKAVVYLYDRWTHTPPKL